MTRVFLCAAIAAAMLVFAPGAFAAPARTAGTPPGAASTYADQCKSLEAQWTSVSGAHETDKYFARASRESEKGHRDCESQKSTTQKSGIAHFKTALKIIGVTPQK